MENKWHEFIQKDAGTYPTHDGDYLVLCLKIHGHGLFGYRQDVVHYCTGDCSVNNVPVRGAFETDDVIIAYWKELDWPEGFEP